MLSDVTKCVDNLKSGKLVLIHDDISEKENFFIVTSAKHTSPEHISIMASHAKGVICVAINEEDAKRLSFQNMTSHKSSDNDLCLSVEARNGVSTGISAMDRSITIQTIEKTQNPKYDLVVPGHIFPIKAKKGGVLERASVYETAIDLLRFSSLSQFGTICQCLNDSGNNLTLTEFKKLKDHLKIESVRISEVIKQRLAHETLVEKNAVTKLPTEHFGEFTAISFTSKHDQAEHLALIKGDVSNSNEPVLARVQSEEPFNDLLSREKLTFNSNIKRALKSINDNKIGVFVYIRHPRKDLLQKTLPNSNNSRTEKKFQNFGIGAQILRALNIKKIVLLSNSKPNLSKLNIFQIEVSGYKNF